MPTTATATRPLLVDTHVAAEMLSISERTLWGITRPRGDLSSVRIGRSVRYLVDDLHAYIQSQKDVGGSDPYAEKTKER